MGRYHAHPTIRIQQHAPHLIAPTGVFAPIGREPEWPQKREDHLPTMRMPRELQIKAPAGSADIRKVWLVSQQNGSTRTWQTLEDVLQVIRVDTDIIDSRQTQGLPPPLDGYAAVAQFDNAASLQHLPNQGWIGPMVVISQDSDHAILCFEKLE